MKKWLALLLAAMMALALVACGDTPANNDNDNKDNDTKTEEFARGSWDGNVYTNDSLNLTVTVPDGWKIATDEELAAIMGITIDSLTEQGVSEEFLKAQNTYEMMAQDPTNGSNVIVTAAPPTMKRLIPMSSSIPCPRNPAMNSPILRLSPSAAGITISCSAPPGKAPWVRISCSPASATTWFPSFFPIPPCLSITPICWRCSASNKQFIQKLSRFRGGFFAGHPAIFPVPAFSKGQQNGIIS